MAVTMFFDFLATHLESITCVGFTCEIEYKLQDLYEKGEICKYDFTVDKDNKHIMSIYLENFDKVNRIARTLISFLEFDTLVCYDKKKFDNHIKYTFITARSDYKGYFSEIIFKLAEVD